MERTLVPVLSVILGGITFSEIATQPVASGWDGKEIGMGVFAFLLLAIVNKLVFRLLDTNSKMAKSIQQIADNMKSCPCTKDSD